MLHTAVLFCAALAGVPLIDDPTPVGYVTVTQREGDRIEAVALYAIGVAKAIRRDVVFANRETVDLIVTPTETVAAVMERVREHKKRDK